MLCEWCFLVNLYVITLFSPFNPSLGISACWINTNRHHLKQNWIYQTHMVRSFYTSFARNMFVKYMVVWVDYKTFGPYYGRLCMVDHIISYLGMKSWDLHVCDRASTITHVDRVKKSNPWYNKIWLCLNVTIWSSQICFSVIFIHLVMIQNIWEKNCTYSHFFQSPVTASAYFWSALKAC